MAGGQANGQVAIGFWASGATDGIGRFRHRGLVPPTGSPWASTLVALQEETATEKSLYLANPYGFSMQQKPGPLPEIKAALEAGGAVVGEPFERNNSADLSTPGWAYRVGQGDRRHVGDGDGIFAVVNGCPPGEGAWWSWAWPLPGANPLSFLFRDDCLCFGMIAVAARMGKLTAEPHGVHRSAPEGPGRFLGRPS